MTAEVKVQNANGDTLPTMVYGTAWKEAATRELVETAVASGFQGIDTANQLIHYQEALVGEALIALKNRGLKRQSLFLQTKFTSVDGQDHRTPYDAGANLTAQVNQSFESSLRHLDTDYIDSYLLHGPYSRQGLTEKDLEVWAAMQKLHESGVVRMIGVSNVNAGQLKALIEVAGTKPYVVQNRCYASKGWDAEVRSICREHKIVYQGFSLLTANPQAVLAPQVQHLAQQFDVTGAQIIFAFCVRVGMQPLTGTTNKTHMAEDLAAPQINLSAADVKMIEQIAT